MTQFDFHLYIFYTYLDHIAFLLDVLGFNWWEGITPGSYVECNMSIHIESKHTVLHNQSHIHSIFYAKYTV